MEAEYEDFDFSEIEEGLYESLRVSDLEEKRVKSAFKSLLRGLINVTGLYRSLDENDSWYPVDIVEIQLTDEKRSGYKSYQHARIVNDTEKKLYMRCSCSDIRGIDHCYVWQIEGYLGDDYSGNILYPLKNGKYFKISYSC